MFLKFAKKIFGSANDRFIGKLQGQVDSINKLEKNYEKLTNQALKNKTKEFKSRLQQKETLYIPLNGNLFKHLNLVI